MYPETYVGGGERYALSLAKAMSRSPGVKVRFVSFAEEPASYSDGPLELEILKPDFWAAGNLVNPITWELTRPIIDSDVVHVHQRYTALTDMAVLTAKVLHRAVFVTDLGGAATCLGDASPLRDIVDGYLCISSFSASLRPARPERVHIIGGGVDHTKFYRPSGIHRDGYFLFVGRLLPHKGINYLIDAIENEHLKIVGQPYDERFCRDLYSLATGKSIDFIHDASDDDLRRLYAGAYATILPSVYENLYGYRLDNPELFGLVLAESMACGTPVICTSVGSLPELVQDGRTGFVVPPNDPYALRDRLQRFVDDAELADRLGAAAYDFARRNFTWDAVAARCIRVYRTSVGDRS
jgi:glycosyltransferase involved in cell wall biosynthesis